MSAEFARHAPGPSVLPGSPSPYFLQAGQGEHAHLFDSLFTVLLGKEETEGQFGVFTMTAPKGQAIPVHAHPDVHEIFYLLDGRVRVWIQSAAGELLDRVLGPGDFGYVPAGLLHSYRSESDGTRVLGVCTGGFEGFFAAAGTRAGSADLPAHPYVPSPEQLGAAAAAFRNEFHPEVRFDA
ncbi:quercetin 2,3-dioxygenase [Nonomuraea zeae]|uniref:Cupin domain-containing protein n=1 Tax=Nonomuraea zeae TaxID=1642303 RepID=A0A5S4GJE8_9ACTN|nr:quercetin 2,3-dioxygenase [Nonomuraea zeae]TMR33078.1 cupin domain-containing protein [Nonomuraea zeae]